MTVVMRVAVLGLMVMLTACATGAPPPPVTSADSPEAHGLHGTWTGTWGGTPLTLFIRDEDTAGGDGGIYLGSWQVAGRIAPTVSGILTFTRQGERVSTSMQGWLRGRNKLAIEAAPSDGRQDLVLNVSGDRLTGRGTSSFHWGPQGEIELKRAGPGR